MEFFVVLFVYNLYLLSKNKFIHFDLILFITLTLYLMFCSIEEFVLSIYI